MSLEVTKARIEVLAMYAGEIRLEGERSDMGIVVRFPLGSNSELIYDHLLDLPDDTDRCENCGALCPDGMIGGLCEECAHPEE